VSVRSALTVNDILKDNEGVGPGFDTLRLLLSLWVFTLHSFVVCWGAESAGEFAANPFHRILITPVLPMFFIVSGYLVTGSALRTQNTLTFLSFRALRIGPALIVEVTLSAMVLGPWLTEKSLLEYFSDPLFARYFLNITGNLHFFLPGLFESNPVSGIVNLNLWTLKPEFYCYLLISLLMFSKVIFNRRYFTLLGLVVLIAAAAYVVRGKNLHNFLAVVDWKFLILAFILGCLAYHWNHRIIVNRGRAMTAVLIACFAFMHPSLIIFGLLAVTYLVVYIGTCKLYLPGFLRDGDYSYGIYLFGFPIQQTLVHFLPSGLTNGFTVLALGLPLTVAFAILSWTLVEKPTLKLKKRFKRSYQSVTPAPIADTH
jgi:peptidoglycan/LPS O-acetylase OafA/YrhL